MKYLEKVQKKTKFSSEAEKLSPTELIEKYKDHFMTDDDIDLQNEKDALDSRNSAIIITHPSFSALMQATDGFRGGELTICGSYTFKGKPGGLTHFFKAFSFASILEKSNFIREGGHCTLRVKIGPKHLKIKNRENRQFWRSKRVLRFKFKI